ncbi:MAG: IS66 family insertion sequence element accessory protein TnpB, partial [Lachnospiraceae bacterium]
MFDYSEYRIFLSCGKTDMRKSINGLCDIVQFKFALDPREKMIFVFCNQARNRLKLLVWEDNGF